MVAKQSINKILILTTILLKNKILKNIHYDQFYQIFIFILSKNQLIYWAKVSYTEQKSISYRAKNPFLIGQKSISYRAFNLHPFTMQHVKYFKLLKNFDESERGRDKTKMKARHNWKNRNIGRLKDRDWKEIMKEGRKKETEKERNNIAFRL